MALFNDGGYLREKMSIYHKALIVLMWLWNQQEQSKCRWHCDILGIGGKYEGNTVSTIEHASCIALPKNVYNDNGKVVKYSTVLVL